MSSRIRANNVEVTRAYEPDVVALRDFLVGRKPKTTH
jgi:hypothetical protein